MDDRLVAILAVSILIISSISVNQESIPMFGFKEARGISNDTLPNASTNSEGALATIYDKALANASAESKKLESSLQSIFSNQLGCQLYGTNCPTDSDPFSISSNASLVVRVKPTTIYESTETPLEVSGRLFNVSLDGDQKVEIDLTDGNKSIDPTKYPTKVEIGPEGKFHLSDTVTLPKDHYLLIVRAPEEIGHRLNSTSYIDPVTRPITLEQVYQLAYQLVIVVPAFVGAIIFLPKWWLKKKESKQLAGIFMEIDNTYSQNRSDHHEVEVQLENLRKRYLGLLSKGKLDQSTFDLVERRIIYLISKDKSI